MSEHYRDHVISIDAVGVGYEWAHLDYDGPGDNRCGWSPSVEVAKSQIDDLIEEDRDDEHTED